jgi:hypothetical protein
VAADEPAEEAESSSARSASTTALWADVRIDPVELALPSGVGYTLRAYRPSGELAGGERDTEGEVDDFDAAAAAVARDRRRVTDDEDDLEEFEDEFDEDDELADEDDEDDEEGEEEEEEEEEEEDEDEEAEEVPVFLARNGKLFLFHSADKLVDFVRSGAEHDLSQLETWSDLVDRVSVDDVVPHDEDTYELDLIVENLRGGVDVWDPTLIIKAGEVARDIGHALRIEPVQIALAPGSPLDDFDEKLRAAESGGIGSFLAKRRLRKVSSQQATLTWRTVIGKISAATDWRD